MHKEGSNLGYFNHGKPTEIMSGSDTEQEHPSDCFSPTASQRLEELFTTTHNNLFPKCSTHRNKGKQAMAVLQSCRPLPLFFCSEKLTPSDKVDADVCLQMHVNDSMEKSSKKHTREHMSTVRLKIQ